MPQGKRKGKHMQPLPPDVITACTMAGIKPENLLNWRLSTDTIVLINELGQKFIIIQAELPQPTADSPSKTTAKKPPRRATKPTTARKA